MSWHKGSDRLKYHQCTMPGAFRVKFHRLGDVWQCRKCQKRWELSDKGYIRVWVYAESPRWVALDG